MADLILKKTDFLKSLSKKQKMSSGEEGSMAAIIDAAKLRQVVDWMNNVEELLDSKLSCYLPLSGGDIDPGPLKYRGKSIFTNSSYIEDSRLSSNIVRETRLLEKANEIKNFINEVSAEIDAKLVGVYKYSGSVNYIEELSSLEPTARIGDCYNILIGYHPEHVSSETDIKINPGDNAVWNGDSWDVLAGIVDLTKYDDKDRELDDKIALLSGEVQNLSTALDHFKTEADDTYAKKSDVEEAISKVHTHANLSVLSVITAGRLSAWNSAEQNAKNYADEQIAALSDVYDGKGAADTAEQNAKTYADEQIAALSDVYDTNGAAATAEQNAKDYADEQVNAVRDSLSNYISKEDAYNAIAPEISAYNNFLSATPDSIAEIIEWNRGLHTALSNLAGLFDSSSEIKDTMELPLEANKSYLITNTGIGSISIYAEPADVADGTITISAYDIA